MVVSWTLGTAILAGQANRLRPRWLDIKVTRRTIYLTHKKKWLHTQRMQGRACLGHKRKRPTRPLSSEGSVILSSTRHSSPPLGPICPTSLPELEGFQGLLLDHTSPTQCYLTHNLTIQQSQFNQQIQKRKKRPILGAAPQLLLQRRLGNEFPG